MAIEPGQTQVTTNNSEEYFAVLSIAASAGFVVMSVSVGKTPAQWVLSLHWPKKRLPIEEFGF